MKHVHFGGFGDDEDDDENEEVIYSTQVVMLLLTSFIQLACEEEKQGRSHGRGHGKKQRAQSLAISYTLPRFFT